MPRHSTLQRCSVILSRALCCVANAGAEPASAPSESHASRATLHCGLAAGLSYCRYPGGAPQIVLLTGLGNTMQSWPPSLLRELNAVAGVVVYDRRGYGASDALPGAPVAAKAAAADLDALLTKLRIGEPVVLVGHSLGGLYAQFFARNYPHRVVGVVLLDPATPFEPVGDPAFHARAALVPNSTQDFEYRGIDASVLATRDSPPFARIPLIVICATDHASPPAFEAARRRIQAETASQSPLGRLVVAEGSGRDIQNDRPAIVVDQVRDFVPTLHQAR